VGGEEFVEAGLVEGPDRRAGDVEAAVVAEGVGGDGAGEVVDDRLHRVLGTAPRISSAASWRTFAGVSPPSTSPLNALSREALASRSMLQIASACESHSVWVNRASPPSPAEVLEPHPTQMRDDPEAADSGSSSSGIGALPHRCGVTPDGGWRHAEPTREDPREVPAARS
jgi:hypothetical protein